MERILQKFRNQLGKGFCFGAGFVVSIYAVLSALFLLVSDEFRFLYLLILVVSVVSVAFLFKAAAYKNSGDGLNPPRYVSIDKEGHFFLTDGKEAILSEKSIGIQVNNEQDALDAKVLAEKLYQFDLITHEEFIQMNEQICAYLEQIRS